MTRNKERAIGGALIGVTVMLIIVVINSVITNKPVSTPFEDINRDTGEFVTKYKLTYSNTNYILLGIFGAILCGIFGGVCFWQ